MVPCQRPGIEAKSLKHVLCAILFQHSMTNRKGFSCINRPLYPNLFTDHIRNIPDKFSADLSRSNDILFRRLTVFAFNSVIWPIWVIQCTVQTFYQEGKYALLDWGNVQCVIERYLLGAIGKKSGIWMATAGRSTQ